ncbi:MAG TPA: hypothetical protein VGK25_11425 [Ignavibacteria bacterium]|jgi:hypothetical protein
MKNKLKFLISGFFFCMLLTFFFSSCSDDSPPTNTNQNTGGPQPTAVGTPNGTPVSMTIGSAGGNMISSDSAVELVIPTGALSSNTDITIQPITNFCYNSYSNAYRLTPDGQQFNQPVTVKFHYDSTTLASTIGMFMGIAHQDASGYWHYSNDISNDTVNRVISSPITHFSDWSYFTITRLRASPQFVRVNQTANLRVDFVNPQGDDDLVVLPLNVHNFFVQSGQGTIISRQGNTAVYRAPAQVPQNPLVTVAANVIQRVNYRGQVIEEFSVSNWLWIVSNVSEFDLRIDMSANETEILVNGALYPLTYTDGADQMLVRVDNNTGQVSVSNILNRFPNVEPPSGDHGIYHITWVPGNDVGFINITNVTGEIYNEGNNFLLHFFHTNAKTPRFHFVSENEDFFRGGDAINGIPTALSFVNRDSAQVVHDLLTTATLTPRH